MYFVHNSAETLEAKAGDYDYGSYTGNQGEHNAGYRTIGRVSHYVDEEKRKIN